MAHITLAAGVSESQGPVESEDRASRNAGSQQKVPSRSPKLGLGFRAQGLGLRGP